MIIPKNTIKDGGSTALLTACKHYWHCWQCWHGLHFWRCWHGVHRWHCWHRLYCSNCLYILLGKVRKLLEWADGLLSKFLGEWVMEWIPLRLLWPFQLLEYQWSEDEFGTLGKLGSAHRALCPVGRTQSSPSPLSHKQISSQLPTLPTSLWLRQPQWLWLLEHLRC